MPILNPSNIYVLTTKSIVALYVYMYFGSHTKKAHWVYGSMHDLVRNNAYYHPIPSAIAVWFEGNIIILKY